MNMTNYQWNGLSQAQKENVIENSYKQEGGNGSLVSGTQSQTINPSSSGYFNPDYSSAFEQYKASRP